MFFIGSVFFLCVLSAVLASNSCKFALSSQRSFVIFKTSYKLKDPRFGNNTTSNL